MNEGQQERLVLAWERLAVALGDLRDEARKAGERFWPQPKPQREVVVSRVENEEDRANKALGIDDSKTIEQWLDLGPTEEDDGAIGERTREWLRTHPPTAAEEAKKTEVGDARPQAPAKGKQRRTGTKKAQDKA